MGAIRRHGSRYMVDVRVGGRRERRLFASREEAEAALQALEERKPARKIKPHGEGHDCETTIGHVFEGWLAHKRAVTEKAGSLRNAVHSVDRLRRHFRPGRRAMDLTSQDVDAFVLKCRERGWRPTSINHDMRVLKAALRWAADPDRGAILPSLPLRIRMLPEPKINGAIVRRHIISDDELEQLLDVCDRKLRAVLSLCAYVGLRKDEVLHLKIEDIDLRDNVVYVRSKPEVGWSPKTHQEREVEMGPRLRSELERYLGSLGADQRRSDAWLFISSLHPGERLKQVSPQVRRAYQRAGITVPRAGCHTLRKMWATRAAQAGDYEALREMGGWSSWAAMAHYITAAKERRRKIADQF